MSETLTFTRRVRVSGVLTDADSAPLLTDSAGTYGVKRLDTGAVVVAHETVAGGITHDGTGLYSYALVAPTPGITYEASFKFIVGGRTTYTTKTLTAVDQAAHWSSRIKVEAHGLFNSDTAADIESNGDATEIAARFETALTRADGVVAFEAAKLQVTPPASTDTAYYPEIVDGATSVALGYLMMGRGEPVPLGKLAAWQTIMEAGRTQIVDALKAYRDHINNRPLPGVFQFIPIVQDGALSDENAECV